MADQTNTWITPANNKELKRYLSIVREAHWYIDFLDTGIEERERTAATPPSDRLYVLPEFSESSIDPIQDENDWVETQSFYDLLKDHRQLFILGDPGMGKTTLLRRISYILSKKQTKEFTTSYGYLIPFLFTLRDLPVDRIHSWEDLLTAYFEQPWLEDSSMSPELLNNLFQQGQAFILLDGLDEIYDTTTRIRLGFIISEGIVKYPKGYWWISSRIVGFNQARFWGRDLDLTSGEVDTEIKDYLMPPTKVVVKKHLSHLSKEQQELLDYISKGYKIWKQLYLAPFRKQQIRQFSKRWFDLFVQEKSLRMRQTEHFLQAIDQHPEVAHLARTPILLTMMALYYRVNEDFPDGRVQLYRSLTDAYLDKIIRRRKLDATTRLSLEEQKRGLSALALHMQEKRVNQSNEDQQLTVERVEAEDVFSTALGGKEAEVAAFFAGLEKKSELLIPKAQGLYGFFHLSYQEFFAAEGLRRQFDEIITGVRSSSGQKEEFWEELQYYTIVSAWHEPIVLFFETFMADWSPQPDKAVYTFEMLFDLAPSEVKLPVDGDAKSLMADILKNEFIAGKFHQDWRWELLDALYLHFSLYYGNLESLQSWGQKKGVFLKYALSSGEALDFNPHLRWLVVGKEEADKKHFSEHYLKLNACLNLVVAQLNDSPINNLSCFTNLVELKRLDLNGTAVKDLAPLAGLQNLSSLSLDKTGVRDLSPLAGLKNLSSLSLDKTGISDLSPLVSLKSLSNLSLDKTGISDLSPLAGLRLLLTMSLNDTSINDLSPLADLQNIFYLSLNGTDANDLSPLTSLKNLHILYLKGTNISDLSPLAGLQNLQILHISDTDASDLLPLSDLQKLQFLYLNDTNTSDLSPLTNLQKLFFLNLNSTAVSDLSPLAGLHRLRELHLDGTAVSDLSPLSKSRIKRLSIIGCPIPEKEIAAFQAEHPDTSIILEESEEEEQASF